MMSSKPVILITGANGYIGKKATERLSRDFQLVGFDRLDQKESQNVDLFSVEIHNAKSLEDALAGMVQKYGNKIAAILHLASHCNLSGGQWSDYQKITIDGTERLFKGLRKLNCHIEQFIFTSSVLIHEPSVNGNKIDENAPIAPKWNYPKSQVLAEDLICRMQGDIPVAILRLGLVYDDKCHCAPLAHQIQRIYEKQLQGYLFPGNLSNGYPFIHVEDVVTAIEKLVQQRKDLPHQLVLNITEEKTPSYDAIQREIAHHIHAVPWKTISLPKMALKLAVHFLQRMPRFHNEFIKTWMVDIADDHYDVNISKARKILGWMPQHQVMSVIKSLCEDLIIDPENWYRENNLHKGMKKRHLLRL